MAIARSEMVRQAVAERQQEVTVRGQGAVVVSKAAYEQLTAHKPSLVEFIRQSPLMGVELDLERNNSLNREFEL